ncbi:MAG TPA: Rieske 2Fe-2S domain-containing protein [Terriglobales bacterium]|jgi:5,5'-dehydrodivanillate O-demethylase|nr:Rieske 2Fe-2S domain-containing protein [Terriglobales bacterium]
MLTAEENEILTRVGPGTPAGELLRRYWHPVAIAADLTAEHPTKFVRILGEDLVLFQTPEGEAGLLHDRCPHRGASLSYGRVCSNGLSCAYHGWLFDTEGNCLETPAEPRESQFYRTVKHRSYPVRKLAGLYWAYLGPQPAPVMPKYDVWARTDGWHWLRALPQLDCNWLQAMENSVDTAHLHILHQELVTDGFKVTSTTRGTIDNLVKFEVEEFAHGIVKRRVFRDGKVEEHPLLFPTVLRQANRTQIRVPIDDTHTWIVYVHFVPDSAEPRPANGEVPVNYRKPFKSPLGERHPFTKFRLNEVDAQDFMAWETQGPILDRTRERLAGSDRGVVLYREILQREITKVEQGLEPMNVFRDPDHPIIDTWMDESLEVGKAGSVRYHVPPRQ